MPRLTPIEGVLIVKIWIAYELCELYTLQYMLSEERVGKEFLDLHTVSAPSGEERTLDADEQLGKPNSRACLFLFVSGPVLVLPPPAEAPRSQDPRQACTPALKHGVQDVH